MCKFGCNYNVCNYISVCPCTGQSEIVPGQSGFNKTRWRYNKFYFLKSKLIHSHQCYLEFYRKKYYTKSCLEHKTQMNATCDSSGPAHSPH